MLNKNIKEEFLEVMNKQNKYLYYYPEFERVGGLEDIYNKDICDFNKQEIKEMYRFINVFSYYKIRQLNTFFTHYVDYCIKKKLSATNINCFSLMNNDDLKECLNVVMQKNKIMDRKQVLDICNQALNARDAFAILCLFEGICGKTFSEIANMTINDIDKENNIVHLPNRDLEISRELVQYAIRSEEDLEYVCFSGSINGRRDFVDNGRIYKNHPGCNAPHEPCTGRTISWNIMQLFSQCGIGDYVKPNDIKESGKICMIKERAKLYNMTPYEYVMSDKLVEVGNRFNCRMVRSLFIKAYGSHLQ